MLLGLYDIAVSSLCRPGERAFRRLQREGKIELDDQFFVRRWTSTEPRCPYATRWRRPDYWTMLWMFVNFYVISFALRPMRVVRALGKAVFLGVEETRYAKWFVDRFFVRRRWRKLARAGAH